LHLGECWAVEGARELEVGKRCSGVLVLIHLVVVLLSGAGRNVEHNVDWRGYRCGAGVEPELSV